MGLFNFKKKKENIDEIEEDKIDEIVSEEKPKKEEKKFSLVCINLGMDEYSFIVKLNNNGEILLDSSGNKTKIIDKEKVEEIYEYVKNNEAKIAELITRLKPGANKDNMIQIELDKKKYVLFRNELNDDVSLFYDMLIHEITQILDINKFFESIKNNFSFEYPNNYEKIPTDDLEKYCLLSNSKPLIMLNDNFNNITTFEILDARKSSVDKIIEDINESQVYEKLTVFDLESGYFEIKSLIVNYVLSNKISVFNFIMFDNKCVIYTMIVDDKEKVDINNLLKNPKIKRMLEIIKSFKILDEDVINS